jgi:hypothetical protein
MYKDPTERVLAEQFDAVKFAALVRLHRWAIWRRRVLLLGGILASVAVLLLTVFLLTR